MRISENVNTSFLIDDYKRNILDYDSSYFVSTLSSLDEIKAFLVNYQHSFIIFEYVFSFLRISEIKQILSLLKEKNIRFLNITNNSEELLFSDYTIIYIDGAIAVEGKTSSVLKEEKIIKRLGFSLPFLIDLSNQLMCYGLVDKVYLDDSKLIGDLWN